MLKRLNTVVKDVVQVIALGLLINSCLIHYENLIKKNLHGGKKVSPFDMYFDLTELHF